MIGAYGRLAGVYDALTADIPHHSYAAFISGIAGGLRGKRVLDAACGTGAMAIAFAKLGAKVQAFDASSAMLGAALQNTQQAGETVAFFTAQLTRFQAHPAELVTCVCDGVNYLHKAGQLEQFIACARQVLPPGGLLVFDVSTHYKLSNMDGQLYYEDTPEVTYFWRNRLSKKTGILTMELTFFEKAGEGYRRFDECHRQRLYSQQELDQALRQAGFTASFYNNYTLAPPNRDTLRLTVVAVKQ